MVVLPYIKAALLLLSFFLKDSYDSPLERGYVPVKLNDKRFSPQGLSLLVYSSSSTRE